MDHNPYGHYAIRVHAKLFADELGMPINCIISKLSEDGGQLTLERPVKLPRRVYLSVGEEGRVFECDVSWWKSNRLFGIRFSSDSNHEARRALVESANSGKDFAPRAMLSVISSSSDSAGNPLRRRADSTSSRSVAHHPPPPKYQSR